MKKVLMNKNTELIVSIIFFSSFLLWLLSYNTPIETFVMLIMVGSLFIMYQTQKVKDED